MSEQEQPPEQHTHDPFWEDVKKYGATVAIGTAAGVVANLLTDWWQNGRKASYCECEDED